MMTIKLFLLLFAAILPSSVAEVFYVTPTTSSNPSCSSPCHTLDQYAQDHTLFGGHTNITMVFLSGQHYLSYDLTISGVDELTMRRQENTTMDVLVNLQTVTVLNISTFLMIRDITLRFGHIEIHTLAQTISLLRLTLDKVTLKFRRKNSTSKFEDSTNINITNTNFIGPGSYYYNSHGILINNYYHQLTSLIIQNSMFTNYYCGVYINSSQVNIHINKTEFTQNAFGIYLSKSHGKVIIADSYIIKGTYWSSHGVFTQEFQGQITVTATLITECQYGIHSTLTNLVIKNTTVSNSTTFGILSMSSNASIIDSYVTNSRVGIASVASAVHIQNSFVSNNEIGMVIPAEDLNIFGAQDNNISIVNSITNCTFSSNNLVGLFLINYRGNVRLRDSTFSRNHGSSILAYQSRFKLLGETVFRDNKADRGGGLALSSSTVTFGPGSNTRFINNKAREYGGAIYTASPPAVLPDLLINIESIQDFTVGQLQSNNYLFQQSCFYETDTNVSVNFIKNNAKSGGLDIYGPTLYTDDCSPSNTKFVVDDKLAPSLRISSDPSRVCFCDNDNQCNATALPEIYETRYPGENFSISVVLTGYNFGRVAGSVYTNVVDRHYKEVIDDTQHVQTANDIMNCTSLKYRIISQEKQTSRVTLVLTVQDQLTQRKSKSENINNFNSRRCNYKDLPPCVARLTTPVYINVNLEECPLGFMLHRTTGICDCDQIIKNLSTDVNNPVICEIQNRTGYIKRRGRIWIGVSKSDLYYLYGNCSRDYCNTSDVKVNLREPDSQCRLNRGGVLCGSCQSGYSLQLGSNHCKRCNHNNNIALLIVFATLGIVLVILLTTLDLTVAKGTINGLIFYANIVWINNAKLFPAKETLNPGYYIITVPIAWLNLDFGIETCFSVNLGQLAKSGMQFVFPVYIWCIAGLIILICHYSTRATKLFGNNSVAVLATLFLLSYGKLLRSITDVFTSASVQYSNDINVKVTVWALDGNIMYNDPRYIILIVVASFFFIVFWLPFTLILLLVPFLRAISDKKPFLWINKLQPFLDTYYGPFKYEKKCQIWTGILLLSRVVLLVIYAVTSNVFPMVNVQLMGVMALILLVYTALVSLLYKNWYLSLLEVLYLLNLIILSGLFPQTNDKDNIATVVTLSVCVALFQFACTIVYHVLKRILAIERIQTCIKKVQTSIKPNQKQGTMAMNESTVHVNVAKRVSTSSELRESLLSDTF